MIKFNEVTWYSKLLAIIFFIAIVPILTFYIGTQFQKAADIYNNVPVPMAMNVPAGTGTMQPATNNGGNGSAMTMGTYKNATYGWSFKYPADWKLVEKADKSGVTITPDIGIATSTPGAKQPPILSITINGALKTAFVPVNTKVGNISYDAQKGALTDSSAQTVRCLPYTSFLGRNNEIKGFLYGASSMSDPAYQNFAVLSDKDYLVLFNVSNYGYTNQDSLRLEAEAGQQKIFDSFTLGGSDKSVVPTCSQ